MNIDEEDEPETIILVWTLAQRTGNRYNTLPIKNPLKAKPK